VFNGCDSLTSVIFESNAITSANFGDHALGDGNNGNNLRTAYLANGAGTYERASGGSTWTKQP